MNPAISTEDTRSAGLRLWSWWVAANIVGWTLGGWLSVAARFSNDPVVNGPITVALGATGAGLLQWLVLRREIGRMDHWVTAVFAALGLAGLVGLVVGLIADADAGGVTAVIILGALFGVTQWLALRRRVARAGWWVLASTVGWIVGGFLSGGVDPTIGWMVIGALSGAVTGTVLVMLLRRPVPGE